MGGNVVLLTIDCLRADRLSCEAFGRTTTPFLGRLASEAVVFSNAFATGPRTAESFPGILTSTFPLMYSSGYALTDRRTSIAEVLFGSGYTTAAFHSNPYLSTNYGYDKGFAVFWDSLEMASPVSSLGHRLSLCLKKETPLYRFLRRLSALWHTSRMVEPFVRAETLNAKSIQWLEYAPDAFFLWLHYMDPHYPYLPGKAYLRRFREPPPSRRTLQRLMVKMAESHDTISEQERLLLGDLYDAEVRYADEQIGHLQAQLQALGLYEDSLIVVTADHGEEFGEHGAYSHATWASEVKDGRVSVKLHDELLHVPLLVRFPGGQHAGQQVDELVSLLDLAPTILDWAGIQQPEEWCGQSLLPLVRQKKAGRPFVLSEYLVHNRGFRGPVIACRTKEWKYIHEGVFGRHELYDLRNDPQELRNVIATQPDRAAELQTHVAEHTKLLEETDAEPTQVDLDEEVVERLRSLGYVE